MIEVIGLSKAYGRRKVLNNLSLSIRPGELALLVGANGCGKSTTLRLLAGLSAADSGRILVNGHDVVSDPPRIAGQPVVPAAVAPFPRPTDGRTDPRVLREAARPALAAYRLGGRTLGSR